MFWRLTTVADDFGRFEADPRVLGSNCFPLKAMNLKIATIKKWFAELCKCNLVQTYVCNGKQYGFFSTWEKYQTRRAKESKFPDPTPESICKQMHTDASVFVSEIDIRNSNSQTHLQANASERKKYATKWPEEFTLTAARRAYGEKQNLVDVDAAWQQFESRNKAKGEKYVDWDQAWQNWCLSKYRDRKESYLES